MDANPTSPRRAARSGLIEALHAVQDRQGWIDVRDLAAVAEQTGLSAAEVYEVASFYAHFHVVPEGEAPPPALTVRVCDGIGCEMAGAKDLLRALVEALGNRARVVAAPCVGACDRAPVAVVGTRQVTGATAESVVAGLDRTEPETPPYQDFDAYRAAGGYAALARDDALERVEASGHRGLGGAGFPVGRKWRFLTGAPKPRMLVVNADEGEPGTFKDRHCLETRPHRVLEGALIAAKAVDAAEVWIYLRDEYPQAREILRKEIPKIGALAEGRPIHLRRGAGAYVCGEETALLESLEGKRGLPRNRPPYPAQSGLFGRPTLVHNVETLWHLRDILEDPDWTPRRFYSVSGRVKEPGVRLAPAGTSVRTLIEEYCGGMAEGHTFAAYLPGGASGGVLPAALGDLPLDFGTLEEYGCFVGSAAVVVLSDRDDLGAVARNLVRFFEDESCGQCTPCREGTGRLLALIAGGDWDADAIRALAQVMRDASICGLGQAAPNPVLTLLDHFGEPER